MKNIKNIPNLSNEEWDTIYEEFKKYENANVWTLVIKREAKIFKPKFSNYINILFALRNAKC